MFNIVVITLISYHFISLYHLTSSETVLGRNPPQNILPVDT